MARRGMAGVEDIKTGGEIIMQYLTLHWRTGKGDTGHDTPGDDASCLLFIEPRISKPTKPWPVVRIENWVECSGFPHDRLNEHPFEEARIFFRDGMLHLIGNGKERRWVEYREGEQCVGWGGRMEVQYIDYPVFFRNEKQKKIREYREGDKIVCWRILLDKE